MNCPKCGLQKLPDQKFCRSCGASLQMDTQPLAEHANVSDLQKPASTFQGGQQRTNRLMLLSFMIMFIGVAMGIIGKKLLHDEVITVVGALISVAGMFLAAYPYLSSARSHEPSAPSQPAVLTPSQPKYLPEERSIEQMPSVTERTTDLLKTTVTRTSTKEDGQSKA